MTSRKLIICFAVVGFLFGVGVAQQALAAFEPGDDLDVVGPVVWGVGVIDCPTTNGCTATLRIKRVEDCEVSTGAVVEEAIDGIENGGLIPFPTGPGSVLNVRFDSGSIMGLPCPAIVTKVKNWQQDNPGDTQALFSFDAQIMFLVPKGSVNECQ